MERKTLNLVDENGDLRLISESDTRDAKNLAGRYLVLARSPELLLLRRRAGYPSESPARRILMAGEILYRNTVMEVINVIVASRWVGTLHVHGPDSHRILGLDKGALRFAESDDPEDRLNKVLFRYGAVSPSQAEEVERGLRSEQRFGEVLVEKEVLSRQQLFLFLRRQVEEILFAAVLEPKGCYVFGTDDEEPPSLIAHLPMQQLLFDCAERLDRMAEYEKLVADMRLCPVAQEGREVTQFDSRNRRVLALCDGTRTVREIASETWLGRFRTMAILYDLLRHDHVRLEQRERTATQVAAGVTGPFNEALRDILDTVERKGDPAHTRAELEEWLARSEYSEELAGVLGPEGGIATEKVEGLLAALEIRDREEVVEHALHDLVSFALFAASLSLPREVERQLSRRVSDRLRPLT